MPSRFALTAFLILGGTLAAGLLRAIVAAPRTVNPLMPLPAAETAPPPIAPAGPETVNPAVQPGKVRWHATLDAALDAAKASGKPVLVFHMMGRLDRQLC